MWWLCQTYQTVFVVIYWCLSLVHTVPVSSPSVATVWDHIVATPESTALNRDTLAFTRKWTRWFQFFKTTRTHRVAKQRLFPGHHRSSSGMNHISTVRPSGKTVANRHELCPRWRYGDSRLGHGVSQSFNPSNLKWSLFN